MKKEKEHHLSLGKVDRRVSHGSQRILDRYSIRMSKDGSKIFYYGKRTHKLRKIINVTSKGFYDPNYGGFYDKRNGIPKYVAPKQSKWVWAYLRFRTKGRVPRSGWYRSGRCCRTRVVEFHIRKYKKALLYFECQLAIEEGWDWKDPILYPFEISLDTQERIKQIRELFSDYHLPPKAIAKMIEIYSKDQLGLKKPLVKYRRVAKIVEDLYPEEITITELLDRKKKEKSCESCT